LAEGEVDVMDALRSKASDATVQALFALAVENKPERHRLNEEIAPAALMGQRVMAQIGG
jgi:molybdenum cofactor biosynthesis enzyme MoaA